MYLRSENRAASLRTPYIRSTASPNHPALHQIPTQMILVANFDKIDDVESKSELASGKPLLEIYNPVLQPWSGKVVAVSEFYEIADEFQRSLDQAHLRSWLAVGFFTLVFFWSCPLSCFAGARQSTANAGT